MRRHVRRQRGHSIQTHVCNAVSIVPFFGDDCFMCVRVRGIDAGPSRKWKSKSPLRRASIIVSLPACVLAADLGNAHCGHESPSASGRETQVGYLPHSC